MNNLHTKLFDNCVVNTHPEWKKLFYKTFLQELATCFKKTVADLTNKQVTIQHILQNGINEYLRPNSDNILKCFNYSSPADIHIVILGDDPYPNKEYADGLAFSYTGGIGNNSLKNILLCLKKNNMIEKMPVLLTGLESWANQNILLLNRFLTRTPEIVSADSTVYVANNGSKNKNNKHEFWQTFTDKIIDYLLELHKNDLLIIMAFGKNNKDVVEKVNNLHNPNLIGLYWTHPSPMSTKNNDANNPEAFINCPHFVEINNILADKDLSVINWDPNAVYKLPDKDICLACICAGNTIQANNGNFSAFAVNFPYSFHRKKNEINEMVSGHMFTYFYKYNNDTKSVEIDTESYISDCDSLATVERAELLSVIMGLNKIYNYISEMRDNNTLTTKNISIFVVTDNEDIVKDINYRINETYPLFTNRINIDLLSILYIVLKNISLVFDYNNITDLISPNNTSNSTSTISASTSSASTSSASTSSASVVTTIDNFNWHGITAMLHKKTTTPNELKGFNKELWLYRKAALNEINKLNNLYKTK